MLFQIVQNEFQSDLLVIEFESNKEGFPEARERQDFSQPITLQNTIKNNYCLYAIVLRVSGQQGAGMHSLVSFQNLTSQLANTVKVLEPIMVNTEYLGIDSTQKSSIHFHDLFDIEYFNEVSVSSDLPPITLRKEFFKSAPKVAIYVIASQAIRVASSSQQTVRIVWSATSNSEPCYNKDYKLKQMLDKIEVYVKKVVEVTYVGRIRSIEMLKMAIFGTSESNVLAESKTIIFNEWRHYWYHVHVSFKELLRPSGRLLSDVQHYEKVFLNSSNNVAVMFRMEHLFHFLERQPNKGSSEAWTMERCLLEAIKATRDVSKSGRPMITIDIGKYGNAKWELVSFLKNQANVKKMTEQTKSLLKPLFGDKSTSFKEWEDSFAQITNGEENGAYIAALQRTLASRAKCLILVGGGTFQKMSFVDYILNHPNKEDQCVNVICSLRSYIA